MPPQLRAALRSEAQRQGVYQNDLINKILAERLGVQLDGQQRLPLANAG